MRLTDIDVLMHRFMDKPPDYYHTSYIVGEINTAPTVDAVPVVHGRWIDKGFAIACSACGIWYSDELPYMSKLSTPGGWDMEGFKCCPHCGAKMDGREAYE